jgi:hypothetical protein
MEVKAAALFIEVGAGRVTVTELCRRLQISRQSYYKYRRRLAELGPEGLLERSRTPRSSPTSTTTDVVAQITTARAALAVEGWDNGATSIYHRLLHDGVAAPSPRTIHRVLVRAGLVVPQPKKRPRSSYRRFQFPCTDDCWQIDGWQARLADGTAVVVLDVIDDCSRYLLASYVCDAETTRHAWTCISQAINRYGIPRLVLSDNSLAFTGRLERRQVRFETNLHQLGVRTIHSAPQHPQTCGKNERSHQTVHRWLAARPTAATAADLQHLLDDYRNGYNLRPHQALAGRTPLDQRTLSRRTPTDATDIAQQPTTTVTTTTGNRQGGIKIGRTQIGLGIEYAGQPLTLFRTGNRINVYYHEHPVTEFEYDPTAAYQVTRRRGGPRRQLPPAA